MSGKELITLLVQRLRHKDIPPDDSNIIIELRDVSEILNYGIKYNDSNELTDKIE